MWRIRGGRTAPRPLPARAGPQSHRESDRELSDEQRAALPPGFVATAEALASGSGHALGAVLMAGSELAEWGTPLGEALDGLRATTVDVAGRDPTFAEVRALSSAWGETTLAYLHGLSCADPVTGLATLAHLRQRIGELYRDTRHDRHALVVTDARSSGDRGDVLAMAHRLTLLGESARAVFSGAEAIGRVGRCRLVVLTARDDALPGRVSLLRRLAEGSSRRAWIEGLPGTDEAAAVLLDELAREA